MQDLRDQLTLSPQVEYPKWDSFEFVTKKKGATGPTKSECFDYYHARLVQKFLVFRNSYLRNFPHLKNLKNFLTKK